MSTPLMVTTPPGPLLSAMIDCIIPSSSTSPSLKSSSSKLSSLSMWVAVSWVAESTLPRTSTNRPSTRLPVLKSSTSSTELSYNTVKPFKLNWLGVRLVTMPLTSASKLLPAPGCFDVSSILVASKPFCEGNPLTARTDATGNNWSRLSLGSNWEKRRSSGISVPRRASISESSMMVSGVMDTVWPRITKLASPTETELTAPINS